MQADSGCRGTFPGVAMLGRRMASGSAEVIRPEQCDGRSTSHIAVSWELEMNSNDTPLLPPNGLRHKRCTSWECQGCGCLSKVTPHCRIAFTARLGGSFREYPATVDANCDNQRRAKGILDSRLRDFFAAITNRGNIAALGRSETCTLKGKKGRSPMGTTLGITAGLPLSTPQIGR